MDADGMLTGTFSYDPFGNLVSSTGPITNNNQPANTSNNASFSWEGQHEKLTESNLTLNPIQMGARIYLPTTGRFLQVDPIEGGTPNNYVYPGDPVNGTDLTGTDWKKWAKDRWNNAKNLGTKVQKAGDRVSAWCNKGYWNGVGCNVGVMALSWGEGSRGGKESLGEFPVQAKTLSRLSDKDIAALQKKGVLNAHDIKRYSGKSKTDLYVDKRGNVYTVTKQNPKWGEPTYYNIKGSGVRGF